MKAKERFRRWGESRGATGRTARGHKGVQDWWPEWARETFLGGWMQGRVDWLGKLRGGYGPRYPGKKA